MEKENVNLVDSAKPANIGTVNENLVDENPFFWTTGIKELFAKGEMQKAIQRYVAVPDVAIIKEVRNPFTNEDTKITTRKVIAMSGTTIEDAVSYELTLVNIELDPVKAINKKYRIVDYTFALEANMSAGKFGGYAAKGLKLMVTKLEEIK